MKSVLMIAYSFPPEGNAGTYRPLRFARHLPKMGWHTRVISADTNSCERYDPGLLDLVPSGTEIVRVRNGDLWHSFQSWRGRRNQERVPGVAAEKAQLRPAHRASVRSLVRESVRRIEAWCYHPDMYMCWIRPAVQAALEMCARRRPNVIWVTGAPWSSFIVAQKISERTGIPYVLDFRSAWTLVPDEFEARRPTWAQHRDHQALYSLLKGARSIIFFHETEAECFWRAYKGALDVSRIHTIPNGYDGSSEECLVPDGAKCTILYTGSLDSYRYNTLLQALCLFKKSDPALVGKLRLLFIGEGTERLMIDAEALGLSDIIECTGPLSYTEITRRQQQAHALLVLGRSRTMKGHELLAGAKLFEYLKVGRPIIGVLPADETKKVLQRVGVSTVADVDSPTEIYAVLRQVLDAWSVGKLSSLVPDGAACAGYSAERQTAALIRALKGTLPVEPFVPGSVDIPPSLRGEIGNGRWFVGEG